MPRNKKTARNSANTTATPPPVELSLKDQAVAMAAGTKAKFTSLQIQLMERALRDVDWEFDPKTKQDVLTLQVQVAHKHLHRILTRDDTQLMTSMINNIIKIICPPQGFNVNVSQTTNVTPEMRRQIKEMTLEDESKLIEAINIIRPATGM